MLKLLKSIVWKRRQAVRPLISCKRPVLDLVDFGTVPGIVLDIGANKGGFASDVLVQAPLMEVHCFEPNLALYERLSSIAASWGTFNSRPRCLVNHAGIGSKNERKELIVTGLHSASSFLPVAAACTGGWPAVDFSETRREDVVIRRLDDYLAELNISKVKLLKLDVQGYELEALKGCGNRLCDVEQIIAEVQFVPLYEEAPLWHEIVAYTAQFGFRPIVMDGFCFGPEGEPLQADILLKRV